MVTAENTDKSRVSGIMGIDGKPLKIQIEKTPEEKAPEKKQTKKQTSGKPKKETNSTGEERTHKKYKTTINLSALKELEGTTASSFLDLARAVILIDNKNYDEGYLALSKERKNDFKRLIEHYAVIEVIGKRKYHIKRVYSKQQREELNELETFSKRDNSKKQ